jgi:hypothetical protein
MWFTIADLAASSCSGKAPKVRHAIRLEPSARKAFRQGQRSSKRPQGPRPSNQLRHLAQMTRHELPGGERAPMTVFGARNKPWSTQTPAPEDPGDYAFPPIAAVTLEPSAGWERDGLITPQDLPRAGLRENAHAHGQRSQPTRRHAHRPLRRPKRDTQQLRPGSPASSNCESTPCHCSANSDRKK